MAEADMQREIDALKAENAKLQDWNSQANVRAEQAEDHADAADRLMQKAHRDHCLAEQKLANIVAHVRTFIDGDCSLDAMEAALEDAYGEAADVACRMNVLRSRNACLRALLELALPSVDHHSRMVGTAEGIKVLDKLADDIRQALAKETGSG